MIPKKYRDLVGTNQKFLGGIFSPAKEFKPTEFNVLDIRWGTSTVVNIKELSETGESSYEHPSFELLLKRKGMKRAQWSRPFAVREIDLKKKFRSKSKK
jgi:hypothetical protein